MTVTVSDRIIHALEVRGVTARAASISAGLSPDGVRGITRNPDSSPTIETIRKLASALDISPEWLAYGTGEGPDGQHLQSDPGAEIKVVGRIGAGGKIDTSSSQLDAEPLYKVKAPFDVPDGALAFQVAGESMWPKYDDGDIVICSMFSEHPDGVVGFPAAIETADGSRYLKRVLLGSRPGLYHLESYNAPLMTDIHVVSFSSVIATIAASQVAKITDKIRRDVMRQIKTGKSLRG